MIATLIASFAYLMTIFIYQYFEQQKVKERLNIAYGSLNQRSSGLYGLFSVYSEADNLFRLYTVNFDKKPTMLIKISWIRSNYLLIHYPN